MLTNTGTTGYVQGLREGRDLAEIDVVLMAVFFDLELEVYFVESSKVKRQSFKLYSNTAGKRKTIRLYLGTSGKFDVVYYKCEAQSAGLCQSILLDVTFPLTY
eukprot:TRINITY_DN13235_c0_g1_i2.p3 TRINITY_DN13235_c0_g1~~TRINITY_DN13235_c0_g1_i2.p3  ORF type:complete len:103 (+),score=18.81 TRINITY_DN13235_c0_g1_i2:203-511(+)